MRYHGPSVFEYGACPYLPNRDWTAVSILVNELDPDEFEVLLESGFRRSGHEFYRPNCATCKECISIRVPVLEFKPSRTQRRVWRENQDLVVEVAPPEFSEERFDLYLRYQRDRWGKTRPITRESYQRFHVDNFGNSLEFSYREDDGRLLAVGLIDATPRAASSVYFTYDPSSPRRLGTFSMLYELDWCRRTGRDHLYMGLYIREAKTMNYKAGYRPHQIRTRDGDWRYPDPGETPTQDQLNG